MCHILVCGNIVVKYVEVWIYDFTFGFIRITLVCCWNCFFKFLFMSEKYAWDCMQTIYSVALPLNSDVNSESLCSLFWGRKIGKEIMLEICMRFVCVVWRVWSMRLHVSGVSFEGGRVFLGSFSTSCRSHASLPPLTACLYMIAHWLSPLGYALIGPYAFRPALLHTCLLLPTTLANEFTAVLLLI